MYVLVNNGAVETYPYTIGNLRRDNPATSFPKKPSDALLEDFGMFRVTPVARPAYDHTKIIAEGTPVLSGGAWTQVWNETNASASEISERTAVEAVSVRAKRDQLLADTDYLALSDNTLSAAMTTYRQALRDITGHANFPFLQDADWPTKP